VSRSDFKYLKQTSVWRNAPRKVREDFTEYMTEREYGQIETLDAFHHFYAGWNCHAMQHIEEKAK